VKVLKPAAFDLEEGIGHLSKSEGDFFIGAVARNDDIEVADTPQIVVQRVVIAGRDENDVSAKISVSGHPGGRFIAQAPSNLRTQAKI
jgi:hypothetical protein